MSDSGPFRLSAGGRLVDRAYQLPFRFDGRQLRGLQGDTLASALLANGQLMMGRSFKYHRPRGPRDVRSSRSVGRHAAEKARNAVEQAKSLLVGLSRGGVRKLGKLLAQARNDSRNVECQRAHLITEPFGASGSDQRAQDPIDRRVPEHDAAPVHAGWHS